MMWKRGAWVVTRGRIAVVISGERRGAVVNFGDGVARFVANEEVRRARNDEIPRPELEPLSPLFSRAQA